MEEDVITLVKVISIDFKMDQSGLLLLFLLSLLTAEALSVTGAAAVDQLAA